jgi:hypothetical protein
VDGKAADLAAHDLCLAHVDGGADPQVERTEVVDDRRGALDGLGRPLEGGEEAVAGGVDLSTVEAMELPSHDGVVASDEVLPAAVAERCCPLGRPTMSGEEDREESLGTRTRRSIGSPASGRTTSRYPSAPDQTSAMMVRLGRAPG